MIVAHNTGNGAWAPQTPDGAQADPTFKPSGKHCRRFVIVAIMCRKVETMIVEPEKAQRFSYIPRHGDPIQGAGRMGEGKTGPDMRIVAVFEVPGIIKMRWTTRAWRCWGLCRY